MARNDIVVWKSPHGGHTMTEHFPLEASETFRKGEFVSLNTSGELTESADDPVDADLLGVAAGDGDTGIENPLTGVDYAADDFIPVYLPDTHTIFKTGNFATDGAGTSAAPTADNIGDEAGFTLASGVWSVDVGATNNLARIMDVLDANNDPIISSGNAGTQVTFVIVAHQNNSLGTADAPSA